jgi:hypothetical protein
MMITPIDPSIAMVPGAIEQFRWEKLNLLANLRPR